MSKAIAIVGAGPGVSLAVAQRFAREGYKVALISRNPDKLAPLFAKLKGDGADVAAFPADVLDQPSLKAALEKAIAHFGCIDVLYYGPTPTPDMLRRPLDIDEAHEQKHLDFAVLGAITAVNAVLPGMLERKDGGILLCSASSAQHPVTFTASFGIAAGAQINYARVLYQELKPLGVYAGFVGIAGYVVQKGEDNGLSPNGLSLVAAQDVADLYWDMFVKRNRAEDIAGDISLVLKRVVA